MAVVIRYIESRYYWGGVVIVSGCRPDISSVVVVRHNIENLWKRSGVVVVVVVMVSFVGETDPPQLFGILRIAGATSRR